MSEPSIMFQWSQFVDTSPPMYLSQCDKKAGCILKRRFYLLCVDFEFLGTACRDSQAYLTSKWLILILFIKT